MKFSGRSCLWVYLIESSAEVTQARVLKMELAQVHKSQNLYKEAFHKTYERDMKDMISSSVSICWVRPSAAPVRWTTSPNKGIHPVYQGYISETPPDKGSILSGRQSHSSETPGQGDFH